MGDGVAVDELERDVLSTQALGRPVYGAHAAFAEALLEHVQPVDYALGCLLGHDIGNSFRVLHHRAKMPSYGKKGFLIFDRIELSHP